MNKKILSLILAIVMVASMLPVNVFAVQSGITAAPSESGSLIAANPISSARPAGTEPPGRSQKRRFMGQFPGNSYCNFLPGVL